jgi:hypothetical protein
LADPRRLPTEVASLPEDLPAPYVNPWGQLRCALLAVLASLRLEAWLLWRRNREGDLPRPEFWPERLAGWFWPVILVAVLVLVTAGVVGLKTGPARPLLEQPIPVGVAEPALPPDAEALLPPVAEPLALPQDQVAAQPTVPAVEPAPEAAFAPMSRPGDLPPDPLLEAFAGEERAELLQAAQIAPGDGRLQLVVYQAGWQELAAVEQQRLAEQWLLRGEQLGHRQLCLLNGQGVTLARSARVGSGMILLAPPLPAHAP